MLLRKKLHDTIHLHSHAILWDLGWAAAAHAPRDLVAAINTLATVVTNTFQARACRPRDWSCNTDVVADRHQVPLLCARRRDGRAPQCAVPVHAGGRTHVASAPLRVVEVLQGMLPHGSVALRCE